MHSPNNPFSIMRKISVAFRSAKVASIRTFAERKATLKYGTMLTFIFVALAVVACVIGPSLSPHLACADEGMIPMSELTNVNLINRGIKLTATQLFNPNEISLVDGVCRVNGCTGSFVSNQGLIITNHHCAFGAIQKASSAGSDYLLNGFNAETLADEIPALDYSVRVTEDYFDVSNDVLAAVSLDMTFLQRTRAIERRSKELEAAAEKDHPGLRAEVA